MATRFLIQVLIISVGITVITASVIGCSDAGNRRREAITSFNKGVQAVKSENLDLAGFHFRRAIILKPDFQEARLNLANVFFLDGNLDAAREEYIKLISEKTEDPRIYFNLGWIYLAQGEYQTAKSYLDTLKKKYPSFADADYGFALLAKEEGEDSLVKFHLQKYLEMDANGRWSDDARNMLSGIPDSDTLIPKLIDEAEEIPQKEPPINTDEKAPTVPEEKKEETTPKQPESTGETKPTVKPPEKTKPEKKEIKKEPETKEPEKTSDLSAIIKDGFKAIEKNDLKTAEKKFKEALKINNNSSDACQGIAKVYFLSRQSSDEKKYVKQMVKSRGANPNDNFELAKGFEKIGDNISAIEHYRNYLASNPFGAYAEEVKKRLTELDKLSTGG